MNQTDKITNPVLVTHSRGGITESFHRGVICVVNEHGNIIASLGDVKQICFPRSALKYFQHIPLITSGAFEHFGFTLKDLALMCGSHNGEDMHVEGANHILSKIGLNVSNLGCGSQAPTHKSDYVKIIRNGQEPTAIHNNCSGKHGGFLAYCVFNGLSTSDYLNLDHPLHQEIRKTSAMMHEMEPEELIPGIDGCSAPIFGMPVYNQAIAYKNLMAPEKFGTAIAKACHMITEAIATYPELIAGTKRYCTDLISVTSGKVIGKTGADGVYSIGIPSKKWGVCIKIDDGKMGPQYNVAQSLLETLNLVSEEEASKLQGYLESEIRNWAGLTTGKTQVTPIVQNLNLNTTA